MKQVKVVTNPNGQNTADPIYPANDRLLLIREEPRGPSLLLEVAVPAQVVSSVNLPVQQDLISDTSKVIVIKSIRLVTPPELATAPVGGQANATLAELQKASILIYAEGWQKGYLIPLLSLNNTFTEGSGIPFRDHSTKLANWQSVQWNKCQIIYSNGTPSDGTAYAFIFDIEYERFDMNGRIIRGPMN
jgi:hypothetical protein